MKKSVITTAAFFSCLLALSAGAEGEDGHTHGHSGREAQGVKVVLTGEVIDMSCYMSHEGKGEKHAKCAKSCVLDKGLPMGILTGSGKVFLIVEDHSDAKAYKQIKELAAEKVEVKGKKYERGGVQAVSVLEVKKVK